jgi:hypothetical protein
LGEELLEKVKLVCNLQDKWVINGEKNGWERRQREQPTQRSVVRGVWYRHLGDLSCHILLMENEYG